MAYLERPDGCALYHEVHGAADAAALILLEGLGGDVPGWRRNVPTLADELRVVAYDLRGNGRSCEPEGPCTMATFVDDTIAILDDLGIDEAHVYGQSFGGLVAQELAFTRPERVRTLVLACTHAGLTHAIPVEDRTVPKGEAWRSLYAPGFPEAHPEHVAEDLRVGASQPRHPTGGRRQWEAMQAFDSLERLPSLAMPALVLHGTEDRTVAPANAALLASRIPRAELRWIEGAGHLFHSERPEEADAIVLDFVRRHADG